MGEMEEEQKKKNGGLGRFLYETMQFVFLALIVVLPIRVYVAQPYIVSGASMYPTFESGDYLIVDQLSYRFNEPEYGDVIVFRHELDRIQPHPEWVKVTVAD